MATGLSRLRREFSEPLKILMAIVALVLLIACANIANLLLARSTTRPASLPCARRSAQAAAHRAAALTESLMLALAGGALGIAFAAVANRLLLRMVSGGPETLPLNVSIDTPPASVHPRHHARHRDSLRHHSRIPRHSPGTHHSLKDGRGAVTARGKGPLAKSLVVSQVALSLVLLVGAGLFLRSLVNLNRVDPGFNRENVLCLHLDAQLRRLQRRRSSPYALYQADRGPRERAARRSRRQLLHLHLSTRAVGAAPSSWPAADNH